MSKKCALNILCLHGYKSAKGLREKAKVSKIVCIQNKPLLLKLQNLTAKICK